VQAAFFLHRQVRAPCAERLGIHAPPTVEGRVAIVLVHLDPLQATGRRFLHEDVAADIVELGRHLLAIAAQWAGQVHAGVAGAYHFGPAGVADQANRVTRYTQADGHLRAHRQPVEMFLELHTAQVGGLVATVIAHAMPGQAGADGDTRLAVGK